MNQAAKIAFAVAAVLGMLMAFSSAMVWASDLTPGEKITVKHKHGQKLADDRPGKMKPARNGTAGAATVRGRRGGSAPEDRIVIDVIGAGLKENNSSRPGKIRDSSGKIGEAPQN